MPDRVIRDDMLDSERYLGLSSDTARMLFVHFVLVADDLGNAEASDLFIRRRLLPHGTTPSAIATLLSELGDADLIRVYENADKRYVHIPRFRQRLRYTKSAHPRPPANLECKEIIKLLEKKSDLSPAEVSPESDRSPQKRREVKRSEEKKTKGGAFALPDWVPEDAWNGFIEMRRKARKDPTDRAKQLLVDELQRLRDAGNDPRAVIDSATRHGWLSFYPPKGAAAKSEPRFMAP